MFLELDKQINSTTATKLNVKVIYEIFMAILALISVIAIFQDSSNNIIRNLDIIIWLIFVMDVFTRFSMTPNKIEYLKKNPFDIIAIIPLDSIFRLARLARLIRLLRALVIIKRYAQPISDILKTNNLDKVILTLFVLIFVLAIPIQILEPDITDYVDAVWWAIVTATTVGYGDISPATVVGRLIAIVLMMFGIGLIGLVTSSIATYFLKNNHSKDDPTVTHIKNELGRIDELTDLEIDRLKGLMDTYKKNNNKESV